jgi:catechol 2,3-dioxygenase-like lactoylglutathione lyase family enzyme
MSIKRAVPDIISERIDESRKFYTEFLGFDVAMDMGWVLTFASPSNPTAQITLVRGS